MANNKIINDLKISMNKMENQYNNAQIDIEKYKKLLDEKNRNHKNLVNKIEMLEIKEREFKDAIKKFEDENEKKNKAIRDLENKCWEISKEENLKALKINDLEFKKFSLENKVRNL